MNLKVFIGACVLSGLVACSSVKQDEAGLSRPGVGLELARFRKEHFSDVRYNLFFSIPESRDEAIRGKVELSLRLDEKQPLIIDFRGEQEQVTSVTLNGGDSLRLGSGGREPGSDRFYSGGSILEPTG